MDNNKYIFILSGAAGAGKSTLANKLKNNAPKYISPIAEICEADDYWYLIGDGKYAFDMKLLHSAHCWCQNKADNLMRNGENLIVSNTNIKSRDRKPYFRFAKEYGYKVVFIHLKTQFKSIHNVPEDVVKRMRDCYESPNSWEQSFIVKSSEMSDDLALLLDACGVKYEF